MGPGLTATVKRRGYCSNGCMAISRVSEVIKRRCLSLFLLDFKGQLSDVSIGALDIGQRRLADVLHFGPPQFRLKAPFCRW